MKAFLIDPHEKEVREIEWTNDWRDISKILDCQYFTAVVTGPELDADALYVDDEGLYVEEGQAFFEWDGHVHTLAGYAMLVGTDMEGETTDPVHTLEQVKAKVTFMGKMEGDPTRPQPWFMIQEWRTD